MSSRCVSSPCGFYHHRVENLLALFSAWIHLDETHGCPFTLATTFLVHQELHAVPTWLKFSSNRFEQHTPRSTLSIRIASLIRRSTISCILSYVRLQYCQTSKRPSKITHTLWHYWTTLHKTRCRFRYTKDEESKVTDAFILAHRFSRYWKRSGDCVKFNNSNFANDGCTSSEKKGPLPFFAHEPSSAHSYAWSTLLGFSAAPTALAPQQPFLHVSLKHSTLHFPFYLNLTNGSPELEPPSSNSPSLAAPWHPSKSIVALSGRPDELNLEPTTPHSCSICCSPLVHRHANHEHYTNADRPVQRRRHHVCFILTTRRFGVPS